MNLRNIKFVMYILVVLTLTLVLCSGCSRFNVKTSDWAKEGLGQAKDRGLIVADIGSDYTQPISRLEFSNLIVNFIETASKHEVQISEKASFSDINSETIDKAYALGIIKGVSTTEFAPSENVTREQIAVMTDKALDVLKNQGAAVDIVRSEMNLLKFKDAHNMSTWATAAINTLSKYRILSGDDKGFFSPKAPMTREQAIIVLNRVYTVFLDRKAEGKIKDEALVFEEAQVDNVLSTIEEITTKTDGKLAFTVKDDSPLAMVKSDQIIVLAPNQTNKDGFAGKVVNVSNKSLGGSEYKVIEIVEPCFEEVFDSMNIDLEGVLDASNVTNIDFPKSAKVYFNNKVIEKRADGAINISSLNGEYADAKINLPKAEVVRSNDGNDNTFKVCLDKTTIYDHDGNENTINDQIKISGEFGLEDLYYDTEFKMKGKVPESIKLKVSGQEFSNIALSMDFEGISFNLGEELNAERDAFGDVEFEDGKPVINNLFTREYSYKNSKNSNNEVEVELEGVDLSDRILIGQVGFEIATASLDLRQGKNIDSPLSIRVLFTSTLSGEISANVETGYKFSSYFEKGLHLHNKNVKSDSGAISRKAGNYLLDTFESVNSAKKKNKTSENEFYIKGEGKVESQFSVGPEIGIMTLGIMPVVARVHYYSSDEMGISGELKITNGKPSGKFDVTMDQESAVLLGCYLRTMLELEVENDWVEIEQQAGFSYTFERKIPLDKIIFSNNPVTEAEMSESSLIKFDQTSEEVERLVGKLKVVSTIPTDIAGADYYKLTENDKYAIGYLGTTVFSNEDGVIDVCYKDTSAVGPRGFKVGMKIEDVLKRLPNGMSQGNDYTKLATQSARIYDKSYYHAEWEYDVERIAEWGFVHIKDPNDPTNWIATDDIQITITDDSSCWRLEFKDGKVSKMIYYVGYFM